MIVCTLDGKAGFPSSADKIKVTYENPFVKDSGSYTYDINFPMAIPGNRRLFGNIQRDGYVRHQRYGEGADRWRQE